MTTIDEKIASLENYLKVKVEEKDWHGVSDVANDLRILETRREYEHVTVYTPQGWNVRRHVSRGKVEITVEKK